MRSKDGTYKVSYVRKWTDDFAPISAGSTVVTRSGEEGNYTYSVGSVTLRKLGQMPADPDKDPYFSTLSAEQREKLFLKKMNILTSLMSSTGKRIGRLGITTTLRPEPGLLTFIKKKI